MGRCWPGAKLLENGRMRDAVLNETLFLELDRATDNRQLGRGLYHGEVAFLVLDYKTQALSAEHLTATGHDAAPPKLRVLAGRSHRAGKRTNRRGPHRRWMGVQWRVTRVLPRAQNLAAMTVRLATKEFTRPRRAGCSVISMQKRFYDLVGTIQEHLHHRADRPIF
jgi:hypothetical protein